MPQSCARLGTGTIARHVQPQCVVRSQGAHALLLCNMRRFVALKSHDRRAILQLQLEGGGGKGEVSMEFSQEELSGFLGKLDAIQSQLDALS